MVFASKIRGLNQKTFFQNDAPCNANVTFATAKSAAFGGAFRVNARISLLRGGGGRRGGRIGHRRRHTFRHGGRGGCGRCCRGSRRCCGGGGCRCGCCRRCRRCCLFVERVVTRLRARFQAFVFQHPVLAGLIRIIIGHEGGTFVGGRFGCRFGDGQSGGLRRVLENGRRYLRRCCGGGRCRCNRRGCRCGRSRSRSCGRCCGCCGLWRFVIRRVGFAGGTLISGVIAPRFSGQRRAGGGGQRKNRHKSKKLQGFHVIPQNSRNGTPGPAASIDNSIISTKYKEIIKGTRKKAQRL